MSELKRKNLCYKCKEPWGYNHSYKRASQIHNIEEEHPNKKTKGEKVTGSIVTISQANEN